MNQPRRKVLIVDDEPDLREIIGWALERAGYEVCYAGNGKEALALTQVTAVDLILSDVRMPGGSGIELLEETRRRNPHIPVFIFLSGFADISIADAFAMGADEILSKPCDIPVLIERVRRVLLPKRDQWLVPDLRISAQSFEYSVDVEHVETFLRLNLGHGGIFLPCSANFPTVGQPFSFRLRFASFDPSELEGEGRVRWVRTTSGTEAAGIGIEYSRFSPRTLELWQRHLLECTNKAFIPKGECVPRDPDYSSHR